MLQLLHSKNLWKEVAKVRGDKPIVAAIAYVNKDHLKLRSRDILICDASDSRIATGATTYALLSSLAKRKVDLWHLDNLHAKIIRLSEHIVVGSANMTSNSESLFEAAVLTDHVGLVRKVDTLLSGLLESKRIKRIDQNFLDHIKFIPVIRSGGRGNLKARPSLDRAPASWIMGYRELSTREQQKSDLIVAAVSGADNIPSYFRNTLKVAEKHAPIQLGDRLIFVNLENKRVSRPVTVTGVFKSGVHLFYTYEEVMSGGVAWQRVHAKLKERGLRNRPGIPAQFLLDSQSAALVGSFFRR